MEKPLSYFPKNLHSMDKMPVRQAQEQLLTKRPFTRRDFLSTSLKAGAAAFTTGLLPKQKANAQGKYNVLFIIVDDLRPLLGCYGYPQMHTPNIDALAQDSVLFNRAYCQFPVCNPSRTSILTGLRPETNGVLGNHTHFRDTVPDVVTLPQHFKTHGYHTRSIGKIVHGPKAFAARDAELSWSVPIWRAKLPPYRGIPSWQALNVDDNQLRDGQIAQQAIDVLEEIQDLQFFLAVGFRKPHMPFNAPTKYYDLYDTQIFKDVPSVTPKSTNEIRQYYSDIPPGNAPFSEEKTLALIRGYAASTSYMDAQVGRVLDQLDTLRLTDNTVIIFVGDHGFHLGEHGTWAKRTVFEASLHSPLIVSFPGQASFGVKTDALVELVDIYPTLCDLCQLPIPSQLEGISMVPVLNQPARPWKAAAFSTVGGKHSIRTKRYRYTEHEHKGVYGTVLYDYETDPNETVNIVNLPENRELVTHLRAQLHAGWRAALPDTQEKTHVLQTFPSDVNNDGIVDIQDLILVANNFGVKSSKYPKVDVNQDGSVDIIDLLLVAAHFGVSNDPTAPPVQLTIPSEYIDSVEKWLIEARSADNGSDIFRQGIAILEYLINTAAPTKTELLPNYPNPFNPETWIPYDLAEDADVHIHIYNVRGESIRELSLGFQTAGTYRTLSRAAYWDGCNAVGERVTSGSYFYTLQAGHFKTTRQMVIIK